MNIRCKVAIDVLLLVGGWRHEDKAVFFKKGEMKPKLQKAILAFDNGDRIAPCV